MADHHVDTMDDFDYSAAAEQILKKRGMFIVDAPPINHKSGNDLWSDVNYPLPDKDDRWANPANDNNQIKNHQCNCDGCDCYNDPESLRDFYEMDDEILHDLQSIKNPVITYISDIGQTLFDDVVYKYTGLALQVREKKVFDISFLKPKYTNLGKDRVVELKSREVITGHTISIATFDGWKYHIFRGLVRDIIKVDEHSAHIKSDQITSGPYGTRIRTDNKVLQRGISESRGFYKNHLDTTALDLIKRNVRIVLDVSEPFKSKIECIPVNQIIDIEDYNFVYNFTIYEGRLNLLWKDWYQAIDEKDSKWTTYVPFGYKYPQNLLHPVIEHQKPDLNNLILFEDPEREEESTDDAENDTASYKVVENYNRSIPKVTAELVEQAAKYGVDEVELKKNYPDYITSNLSQNIQNYLDGDSNIVDISVEDIVTELESIQNNYSKDIEVFVIFGNYSRLCDIFDNSNLNYDGFRYDSAFSISIKLNKSVTCMFLDVGTEDTNLYISYR